MKRDFKSYILKINRKGARNPRVRAFAFAMACLVLFCTIYSLVLPLLNRQSRTGLISVYKPGLPKGFSWIQNPASELRAVETKVESFDGFDDVLVSVSGRMPEGTRLSAIPVRTRIEGADVLFALDIALTDESGKQYIPQEKLHAKIFSPDITAGNFDVWNIPDTVSGGGNTGGHVDMRAEAKDGFVSFDKLPSNTYAVVKNAPSAGAPQFAAASPNRASLRPLSLTPENNVEEEGDIVDEDTDIHWKLTKDVFGKYTLTFSGSGAIPDYSFFSSSSDTRPWKAHKSTPMSIVIGDGITRIGRQAFYEMHISSVSIGAGVTSIGQKAFAELNYHSAMTSVVIPGNVETIEKEAFKTSNITSITLREGVKTIEEDAFRYNDFDGPLLLPASLVTFGNQEYMETTAYNVAETNPHFTSVDGVLYNKSMTELLAYPELKVAAEYTVPASVTTIRRGALEDIKETKKIVIPSAVTSLPDCLVQNSSLDELVIEAGAISTTEYWLYCANVGKVTFPENVEFEMDNLFGGMSPSIPESLTIPKSVTRVGNQTSRSSSTTVSCLTKLVYNAQDAEIKNADGELNKPVFPGASYVLEIGEDVDELQSGFKWISCNAESVVFDGLNFFTVDEGAFGNDAPEPFKNFSGSFYADGDGALYKLDTTNNTAKLIFVPGDVVSLTVPAQITNGENIYSVTGVARNALKQASALTSISFAAPGTVVLEDYALANCPKLGSVESADISATTVADATALFGNDNVGRNAFYNTGLTGADSPTAFERDMDGSQSLTVTLEGAPVMGLAVSSSGQTGVWTHKADNNDIGGYRLLTGDSMTITASVGNTAGANGENYVYRVYVQKTGEDCSLGDFKPGQTQTFNGQDVICHATDDPYTICLEFVPGAGVTVSFPITSLYPSPASPGGGVTVWGEILDKENNIGGHNLNPTPPTGANSANKIQASWRTKPDPFKLTKTNFLDGEPITVQACEEGNGFVVRPEDDMQWEVTFKRTHTDAGLYGKDYITSVDVEDSITLPEKFEWDPDVKTAIQNGEIYPDRFGTFKLNGKEIFKVGRQDHMSGLRVVWDNTNDKPVFRWKWRNLHKDTEIDGIDDMSFYLYPDAIRLKSDQTFGDEDTVNVTNEIKTTAHYTHSGDKSKETSANIPLEGKSGDIAVDKERTTPYHIYFGESAEFIVRVYNEGTMPWTGSGNNKYTVEDEMAMRDNQFYITPGKMERMFEEADVPLTITIKDADIANYEQVTDTDGGQSSYKHVGNSKTDDSKRCTLTITAEKDNDDVYTYTVVAKYEDDSDTTTESGASLKEILQTVGFAVTHSAKYICSWALGTGEDVSFGVGEEKIFYIHANVKDTFSLMGEDWPSHYAKSDEVSCKNTAKAKENNSQISRNSFDTAYVRAHPEAYISKGVLNSQGEDAEVKGIKNGEVLSYTLAFDHRGKGEYDNLPLVDKITGSQYLLVPKTDNTALEDRTPPLDTHTIDGVEYYKLGVGEYTDVKVGVDGSTTLTAASVTVSEISPTAANPYPGISTEIKWYFPHIDGRDYRKTVEYKTLVDMSLTGGGNWAMGNTVWVNDKPKDRIYVEIGDEGTLLEYDKHIVTKGVTPAEDVLDVDNYSIVNKGDSVMYRLTLHNTADFDLTLSGLDIVDCLPETFGEFTWEKGTNVVLTDIESGNGTTLTNIDDWSITDVKPEGLAALYGPDDPANSRQYIVWNDQSSITFTAEASVYLYFTLTFPNNTDEGQKWSEYVAAVRGQLIDNNFYVYRFPNQVWHELREPGKAAIQKGVLSLSWTKGTECSITPHSSRRFYNNEDATSRFVSYYVVVYNGGYSRLYLDDIYDALPQGFTYMWLDNNLDSPGFKCGNTETFTGEEDLVKLPTGTRIMSAEITAHDATPLRFSIGHGQGDDALKHDDRLGKFYLDNSEALVFAYQCMIGEAADTEDIAVNTVGMRYTDHLAAGVNDDTDFRASANNPRKEGAALCIDNNDGNHSVQMPGQLQGSGFPTAAGEEWLVSEVTLQRGEIVPGVTKFTESYTPIDAANSVPYTNSVTQNATVNWKVRFSDSGTRAITDYTITDIMPAPYVFTGTVRAEIHNADGTELLSCDLFEVTPMTDDDNVVNSIKLKILDRIDSYKIGEAENTTRYEAGSEITVAVDGETLYLNTTSGCAFEISFAREINDLKLILHILKPEMSIPECGGYMDLFVSGKNPTMSYNNGVYTNRVDLKPEQHFTSVCAGSGVIDGGTLKSVKNSAPFTVAFGYATSSSKSVTEKDVTPTNKALSTEPDGNCIVLAAPDSGFTYTLTVDNTTEKAMKKLVLIDNLPNIGDHSPFDKTAPRGSAFKVNFAQAPNVTVKVEKENEEPVTLASTQYTVQYSATTNFGGTQSLDWKGETSGTTATWGSFSADARSIRVIINDSDGTLIPAKSRIELSFDAVAEGTQTPGAIAWNSFGYHYALVGVENQELEAMPLPVGVKTPSVPKLKKSLTDLDGLPYEAEQELTFKFTISDGSAQSNPIELKVPANASSAEVLLDSEKMGTDWVWDKDKTYTIQETENAENFELGSWTNVTSVDSDVATFSYEPGKNLTLECTNIRNLWSLTLNKVSAIDNTPLSGAVFALYSPNEGDKMNDTAYGELTCNPKPAKIRTVGDETWYLQGIETTGADGTIKWENLTREKYCLFEVTPPPGYYASAAPIIVARSGASTVVTAENETGFVLPDTGGRGIFSYALAGMVLMVFALGLQLRSMLRDRRV